MRSRARERWDYYTYYIPTEERTKVSRYNEPRAKAVVSLLALGVYESITNESTANYFSTQRVPSHDHSRIFRQDSGVGGEGGARSSLVEAHRGRFKIRYTSEIHEGSRYFSI